MKKGLAGLVIGFILAPYILFGAAQSGYFNTLTSSTGKVFTYSNTLTLTGTDGSTLNVGTGGTLGTAAYTASTAYAPAANVALYREPDQGVAMTAAASGSSGLTVADNDNIDMVTNNFALYFDGIVPDFTPAANLILMQKLTGGVGYQLEIVATTGIIRLTLNATAYNSSVAPTATDGTKHKIVPVVTVGAVNTTVDFYVDGVVLGTQQTAANPGTVSNAAALYILGTSAVRTAGTVSGSGVLNFAPTAAEVLDMYRNGIPESWKWGSQTSIITNGDMELDSNWSSWLAPTTNARSSEQAYTGTYSRKCITTTDSQNEGIYQNITTVVGKKYQVEGYVYADGSNAISVGVYDATGGYRLSTGSSTAGWVFLSKEFTATETTTSIGVFKTVGSNVSVHTFYADDMSVRNLGPALALLPDSWQADKPYDLSSNNLTCSYPATGWSLTRPTITRISANSAITSFAGTISVSGTTATFSSAADCSKVVVGSTIIAGGATKYVTKLTNATNVVIDSTVAWSGTAITSIQDPQWVSSSSGTTRSFVAANGSITTVLTSNGSILFHRTVDGNVGIGTTSPGRRLTVNHTTGDWASFQYNGTETLSIIDDETNIVFATPNVIADRGFAFNTYTGEKVRITNSGNVGIGTTDLDGTPPVGRLTVKGSTNNGSTNIFVGRDSDEANVVSIDTNGNATFAGTTINMTTSGTTLTVGVGADNGTVSAGVFTDRTASFEGDALAAIAAIKSKGGEIDHDTLPEFVRKTNSISSVVFETEVLAADAFETIAVEEDETEDVITPEVLDEEGKVVSPAKTEKKPIILSKTMIQKGYKIENQQVIPNMVEEVITKKVTKQVTQLKKDVKFDNKTGKFYLRETRVTETPGRNLGAQISVNVVALQQLIAENVAIKARLDKLEKK